MVCVFGIVIQFIMSRLVPTKLSFKESLENWLGWLSSYCSILNGGGGRSWALCQRDFLQGLKGVMEYWGNCLVRGGGGADSYSFTRRELHLYSEFSWERLTYIHKITFALQRISYDSIRRYTIITILYTCIYFFSFYLSRAYE